MNLKSLLINNKFKFAIVGALALYYLWIYKLQLYSIIEYLFIRSYLVISLVAVAYWAYHALRNEKEVEI